SKRAFDDFRSEINARYGLADPEDPHRVREIAQPDYLLKIAAEALRRGEKPQDDMRMLIDAVLSQRAVQGVIRNRSDVIDQVASLGLKVTREGKNYITVSEAESGLRWRMKGGLYEREFNATRAIEAEAPRRWRDFGQSDRRASSEYAEHVQQHISARANYHAERYATAAEKMGRKAQSVSETIRRTPEEKRSSLAQYREISASVSSPEHNSSLNDFVFEQLGNEYISGKPHRRELDKDQCTGSNIGQPEKDTDTFGETYGRIGYNPRQERGVCHSAKGSENRRQLDGGQSE
ncbi:hypothetical protein KKI93_23110, partial [Xenorhabdus bovienii]|uniref:hypothetical protein n=1 Tax=Xenorhabdus bovienii TaxID=40576 RepID=UPI002A7105CE|nr:hypothetical protein [Xenorhabdus bovienii]